MASSARLIAGVGWMTVMALVRHAAASDLDLSWSAANDCADQEQLRTALSRRLAREVTFGGDASLRLSGTLTAVDGGYQLELSTGMGTDSEDRRLQARSCGELVRATLLIAELLLRSGPDAAREVEPAASPSGVNAPRGDYLLVRLRAIGDLGSLGSASLGPGVGIGLQLQRTRFELGGMWLPPQELNTRDSGTPLASMQLATASASICRYFLAEFTLAPCLSFEAGRLNANGQNLVVSRSESAAWLAVGLGGQLAIRLFDRLRLRLDLLGELPLSRAQLAIEGIGVVHAVPAVLGRLELSVEARL